MDSPGVSNVLQRSLLGLVCFLLFAVTPAFAESSGSVGIQVVPIQSGELVVIAIVPGSSAEAVGVKPGDMLVQIDDMPLRGSNFKQVAQDVLPGPAGTSVLLTWMRPGQPGTRSARLKRLPIEASKMPTTDIPTAGPQ